MNKITNIETIAEKIGDPVKKASALSKIAFDLTSPLLFQGEAELKEREVTITKDQTAALEALKSERLNRIAKASGPNLSFFWIGTIVFGVAGFLLMTFAKPVIEAFGKALGEAMVKDFDLVKRYERFKDTVRVAGETKGPETDGPPLENAVTTSDFPPPSS